MNGVFCGKIQERCMLLVKSMPAVLFLYVKNMNGVFVGRYRNGVCLLWRACPLSCFVCVKEQHERCGVPSWRSWTVSLFEEHWTMYLREQHDQYHFVENIERRAFVNTIRTWTACVPPFVISFPWGRLQPMSFPHGTDGRVSPDTLSLGTIPKLQQTPLRFLGIQQVSSSLGRLLQVIDRVLGKYEQSTPCRLF